MNIDWDGAIGAMLKRGRGRGEYENVDGRVCLFGAVLCSSGKFEYNDEVLNAAADVLALIIRQQYPDKFAEYRDSGLVIAFNDALTTTDQDALLVLEKARANS